ncbi:MAG: sulfotransferase [Deltaproteobacteria bacterium]|nr:MAG: sulfotransferase [Deltaproteobacteria bacterium]
MQVLTLRWPIASPMEWRPRLREAAAWPVELGGLCSRHFRLERSALCGRYVFSGRVPLHEFIRDPRVDPAYDWIARLADASPPEAVEIEELSGLDRFDRPLFVISAPRAGSTLLYDLLARAAALWTIGGESHGVIEGIAAMHPARRGFDSHRLTDLDADPDTVRALRAGLVSDLRDHRGRRLLELPDDERPEHVRLLEKTPENALRVPFLAAAFPDARFAFLHRDARQSVSSIIEAWHHDGFVNIPSLPGWRRGRWHLLLPEGWRAYDGASLLDIAVFQWSAANLRALEDLEMLPRDRWISVDYAELIAAPRATIERVCRFAEIDVDPGLAAALARPLPETGTTITPPSPIKWRSNPEFRESALAPHAHLMARLRELHREPAPPPPRPDWTSRVRYACFLDQAPVRRPSPEAPEATASPIVAPSLRVQIGATVPLGLVRRTRFRDRFRADFPLLWIEDPATCVLYPFWAQREHAHALQQLVAGQPPPPLDGRLREQLARVGVITTELANDARIRATAAMVERARAAFETGRYGELPGLLHLAHSAALARYYRALVDAGGWGLGDAQVRLRHGWHNEPVARYFHHQLTDLVSRVAGEPVRPSYCYVSAYREGAVLRPHVDRKQCVFTVSLWVEDAPAGDGWPLWFHTAAGIVSLTQGAGDAVLFAGCELPHWRDRPPPGGAATTLLFHYVPRDFVGVVD